MGKIRPEGFIDETNPLRLALRFGQRTGVTGNATDVM